LNLLNKQWINIKHLKVTYEKDCMVIENDSNIHKFLTYPNVFKCKDSKEIFLNLEGKLVNGTGCTLKILNRHRSILGQCGLNSLFAKKYDLLKYFILTLYVPANSKMIITKLEYKQEIQKNFILDYFKNDTLLITPGYPSLENKYNTAFVHTRVQEYKRAGMNLDVAVINGISEINVYEFEGIQVFKGDYFNLREILQKKKYKKIIAHFFDDNYAKVFDSINLTETELFFYLHGADVLYRDYPKYASHYFESEIDVSWRDKEFEARDYYFKKYNGYSNVKWMFVSEFVKNRAEELLNIEFKNYEIIPCYIDTNLFEYQEKDINLRKRIFILRRFTNDCCYALDIDIRAILELSTRPCFNDLEFDIYGDGEMFEVLTQPLKNFSNVHLHREFLSHEDIKKVQDTHGIGLFASRFDTQGVSLCEAAASGCAVVTSNIPAIESYIDPKLGVTCEVENFKEYADVIEKLYNDPDYFSYVSKSQHQSIVEKFNYSNTIEKELNIFKNTENKRIEFKEPDAEPILTVIVPAYNVEQYLMHGVMSLLNQPYANKLEILIVNDGSHDATEKIAKELQEKTTINNNKRKINC